MKISKAIIYNSEINFSSINLIVGANNTGKSTLLRDLYNSISAGFVSTDSKWLDGIFVNTNNVRDELNSFFSSQEFTGIDDIESRVAAEKFGFKPFRHNMIQNFRSYGLSNITLSAQYQENRCLEIKIPKLDSVNQLSSNSETMLRRFFADIELVGEFCDSRLLGGYSTTIQNILSSEMDQSPIRYIRENVDLLKDIQDNIFSVFGIKIGFDDLQQGFKPLRLLPKEKISTKYDQKTRALKWQETSMLVDQQGDGLKAYLKLALALLDPCSKIIFIDEPETFLHPPQRRALGKLIADLVAREEKQVLISTHDSEFIRGVLNVASDVNVFNLKNTQGLHTFSIMDLRGIKSILEQRGNELKERKSILNEEILKSLFFEKTILTENENDRCFYDYYASLRHSKIVQNRHFIGLRGLDEVLPLAEKLYNIGVNVAFIVDIDYLLNRTPPNYIKNLNSDLYDSHCKIKNEYCIMSDTEKNVFHKKLKKSGIESLENINVKKEYEKIIDEYNKVGVYIPKVGELESWTNSSKNNLSQMVRIIERKNPRNLNKFMKAVLK